MFLFFADSDRRYKVLVGVYKTIRPANSRSMFGISRFLSIPVHSLYYSSLKWERWGIALRGKICGDVVLGLGW